MYAVVPDWVASLHIQSRDTRITSSEGPDNTQCCDYPDFSNLHVLPTAYQNTCTQFRAVSSPGRTAVLAVRHLLINNCRLGTRDHVGHEPPLGADKSMPEPHPIALRAGRVMPVGRCLKHKVFQRALDLIANMQVCRCILRDVLATPKMYFSEFLTWQEQWIWRRERTTPWRNQKPPSTYLTTEAI